MRYKKLINYNVYETKDGGEILVQSFRNEDDAKVFIKNSDKKDLILIEGELTIVLRENEELSQSEKDQGFFIFEE